MCLSNKLDVIVRLCRLKTFAKSLDALKRSYNDEWKQTSIFFFLSFTLRLHESANNRLVSHTYKTFTLLSCIFCDLIGFRSRLDFFRSSVSFTFVRRFRHVLFQSSEHTRVFYSVRSVIVFRFCRD